MQKKFTIMSTQKRNLTDESSSDERPGNKRIVMETLKNNDNDDDDDDTDILDYPIEEQKKPYINYDDDGDDDVKIGNMIRRKKNHETRNEIKQHVNNASNIMNSIKVKKINALIPNLATIVSLSKETSDHNSFSEKLTKELVTAIEHNVRDFLILDNYLKNDRRLMKRVDEKNQNINLDLEKTEMRIRELWVLAGHLNSIDSSISIKDIIKKLRNKFQKLKNLAEEYDKLNEIYQENKKVNDKLQKDLNDANARESKLLLELNELKKNIQTNSNAHEKQVEILQLQGTVYEQLDIINDLRKDNVQLTQDMQNRNDEILKLQQLVEQLQVTLQTVRETKTVTQKIYDGHWKSGVVSKDKKDRIAYRISKIVDSLHASESDDFFPRYLLNFTNLMLNEERSDGELNVFLDDIKQINDIVKSSEPLAKYIDEYLTHRQVILRDIKDMPQYDPSTYLVPMELAYEFSDVDMDESVSEESILSTRDERRSYEEPMMMG